MTFKELKDAIQEMRVYPSQLFSREEIFGEIIVEQNGQITFRGGDAQFTSYLTKKIPSPEDVKKESQTKIDELEKKVKELEPKAQELSKLQIENLKLNAKDEIFKYADTKKLSDGHKKFLEINLDKFAPSDNKDEAIKTFVDAQISDYQKFLTIHPVQVENPPTINGSNGSAEASKLEHELKML